MSISSSTSSAFLRDYKYVLNSLPSKPVRMSLNNSNSFIERQRSVSGAVKNVPVVDSVGAQNAASALVNNQTLCLFEEKEEIGIIAMIYRYQLPISAPGILLLKNKTDLLQCLFERGKTNQYHY